MYLRKFHISGLFGRYEHSIDLADPISIIMGDNGVGKTVMLRAIKAILECDFHTLLTMTFSAITVSFSHKKAGTITYIQHQDEGIEVKTSARTKEGFWVHQTNISSNLPPYIREVALDRWIDIRSHNIYTADDLRMKYHVEPYSVKDGILPGWYINLYKESNVLMIHTQRLYKFGESAQFGDILTINLYSRKLAEYMSSELSSAGNDAAAFDRTFPVRLVRYLKANVKTTANELIHDMQNLEAKRRKLSDIGVISEEENDLSKLFVLTDNEKDKVLRSVFKLYIKDSHEKLQRYDSLSQKASLFLDIINSRFMYKYLTLDRTKGFVVRTHKDSMDEIPIDKLSSGEQNEIILFYDLIFNTPAQSLVLIDEPEISLHLEWLQKMLEDFKRVSELNGIRMLIATHSPDFVGNNYNLVQNLSYE